MCPHLEKVKIYQCGSHACGTEALRCLPKLQFLEIHVEREAVGEEDEDLAVYIFCFPKHISTLVLHFHTLDVDLEALCHELHGLRSLTRLHLCHSESAGKLSLALRYLRSLESLHLQGFSFSTKWASRLSCLTKLTLLSFAGLKEPVPLHELASLPTLQTLHLKGHDDSSHSDVILDLDVLPELPPALRELRVIRITWDHGLSSLRGLANLRVCMLDWTGSVSLPAHMPHLHTLVLDCNDGLVLEDHLTGFTALRLLSLRGCGQVIVPSAFHQLAALPHLTCIDVAECLPVNQLDWSAYEGLPLDGVPGSSGEHNSWRPHLAHVGFIDPC